jgi:hypothetical protein
MPRPKKPEILAGPTESERGAAVDALWKLARVWAPHDREGAADFRRLARVIATHEIPKD